jgi:hypothetical protein
VRTARNEVSRDHEQFVRPMLAYDHDDNDGGGDDDDDDDYHLLAAADHRSTSGLTVESTQ